MRPCIKEVTHDPEPAVVFDLQIFDAGTTNPAYAGTTNPAYAGCLEYRSYRIPDFYSHQAQPVSDLTLRWEANQPLLQFSADPTHDYAVPVWFGQTRRLMTPYTYGWLWFGHDSTVCSTSLWSSGSNACVMNGPFCS